MEATKENGWEGEGWYIIRFWDTDLHQWSHPETPEPIWLANQEDFEAETDHYYDFYEAQVEHLERY